MMWRPTVIFALIAIALAALPAHAADPVFPTGSRIGFVPPPGFTVSKRFPGFENVDTASSFMVIAMPTQAYAEIESTMTPEAVKQHGIAEDKRETLTLPNGRALLVAGMEDDNGQKVRRWMLLGLVPEGAALASVAVPESGRTTYSDAVIRASLLTLAARATVPMEELLSLVPFRLTELSGLRPVRVLGSNGVFLTDGPKDAPDPGEQPVFVVSIAPGGPEQADGRANFARNLFTGLGDFKDVRIVSGDMLRLGGGQAPTHELQAEAKNAKTEAPMKLVQWVRFGPGFVVRMVGVASADQWSRAFPQFRAVRDGVAGRE